MAMTIKAYEQKAMKVMVRMARKVAAVEMITTVWAVK